MHFSLKLKFIITFVFLGLFMAGVSSIVYYLSFKNLIRNKMKFELTNEAQEFAEHVIFNGHRVQIDSTHEWEELEHVKNSDYSRYLIITDGQFRTIRKTDNLGYNEFQTFFNFQPTTKVQSVEVVMDSLTFLCVVYPVMKGDVPVAYVLSAANSKQVSNLIKVFEQTIVLSLLIIGFIGAVMAYFLANRITKPLSTIGEMADHINLKSLDKRIAVSTTETEIQNLTDTLNHLLERLERSFGQINEFSSNVSHELRTPLTILRGNIEVAMSRQRTVEEYEQILSELQEETLHIIRIVDDLLLLARADADHLKIEKTEIRLKDFCDEFSKDWEAICSIRSQPLHCDMADDITIIGDKSLMYQLFLNVISNASKYSPESSPISISVHKVLDEVQQAYLAECVVLDKGIGIPDEDLASVFDRFYRVSKDRSRETGGTGLGLSICKMITDLHGGTIRLQSRRGEGTMVTVRLPIL
jgi:heavy metal sensor kinase